LTNDDGIESPGLAALYEELRAVADVTVVAPAENQSGVGRARSRTVDIDEHEWGYAVHGTPADCAVYGIEGLDTTFDLVVSGCNLGPNCGEYIMGHSGTVGAVVEGAFLGTPGIAVSGYHREEFFPPEEFTYGVPATATRKLVELGLEQGVFERVDYLSVNAPVEDETNYRVTRPLADYDVGVRDATEVERAEGDGEIYLDDDFWAGLSREERYPTLSEADVEYPAWSDRAAVMDGDISVSPHRVPQETVHDAAVDRLIVACNDQS
jgi:5'-nucleotidase